MDKCCHETFIKAIEEVIYTINAKHPKSLEDLKETLLYAISELKKPDTSQV